MRIALTGPHEISDSDRSDIRYNLQDFLSKGHEIHILAYMSIELEIFSFFIEQVTEAKDDPIAKKLHIYSIQPKRNLPKKIKKSIDFLEGSGATFTSFNVPDRFVTRSNYVDIWREILDPIDGVVSFFDNKDPKLMIPIDIAADIGLESIVCNLPSSDYYTGDKVKFINRSSPLLS